MVSQLPADSVFYRLGQHGLISFTDYVFLLVVLSSMSFICNYVHNIDITSHTIQSFVLLLRTGRAV